MKKIVVILGVLCIHACKKTETPSPPPSPVVQEESIKFTTNLDTGNINVTDTIPLVISVSSKIPTAGVLYLITATWTDSSKQIFKLDTSLSSSSLSQKIPGFMKAGNYTLSISVTSKSTTTNSLSKSILFSRNNYTLFTSTIPIQVSGVSNSDIITGINGSVSGTIFTKINGKERLIVSPTLFFSYPLLPALNFMKNGNAWSFENSYTSGAMGAGRNYECLDTASQTWVISDFGLELSGGNWPGGSIYLVKNNGNQLSYTNLSSSRSYYHSVSTGDLNNDGLKDIVGLNMGSVGNIWPGSLHPYIQNSNGSFSEDKNLINDGLNTWSMNKGAGAVLVIDVLGDNRPEIIRADYGFNSSYQNQSDRYSFVIYSYDNTLGKYTVVKNPGPLGVYANNDRGTTSIKANDFDNDGDLDIAVATEGTNFNGIEIWQNNGQGNFTPSANKLEFTFDQMQFREFDVIDVNNDGFLDIVLIPFHYGKLFRVGGSGFNLGTGGVYLNNLLWMNNKGSFSMFNKQIIVPNIKPAYLKSGKINGQFKFIGLETNSSNASVNLYEIPFIF
ncbi:MAG: hypothetical protein RJA53_1694 [Bacteroidota bacterium]|jgi:hypothetical protein